MFESAWGFRLAGILVGSKGARIVVEGAAGIERLEPGIVAVYRPKLTPPSAAWLSVLYSKVWITTWHSGRVHSDSYQNGDYRLTY